MRFSYTQPINNELFFADLVLLPRKNVDAPAIVIELKYDKAVDTALDQIKRKQYPSKVAQYTDHLLLVGITYNRETKQHQCRIEKYAGVERMRSSGLIGKLLVVLLRIICIFAIPTLYPIRNGRWGTY